mgnify:CR=1 FL=1
MLITTIDRQKKNSSRRSIFLDGQYAFSMSEESFFKHALHEGDEVEETFIKKIQQEEENSYAKQVALRFRSYRPRSQKEIKEYLVRQKFPEQAIRTALQFLEEAKLLDDAEFARMLSRDLIRKKPIGKVSLQQTLFKKGIGKEIISSILSEYFTQENEEALALTAAQKQYKKLLSSSKKTEAQKLRKKLFDFLARRGFSASTSFTVIKQILTDSNE